MTSSSARLSQLEDLSSPQIIEERFLTPSGDCTLRKYSKGKLLGKGGFARCYEFTSLDTRKVMAAKIVPKASLMKARQKQKLMNEIRIHKSIQHSNIVGFEHFFEDSENVYMLLELCKNQTMSELVRRRKRLVEVEVQCYALQVVAALEYLHSHKVIHRDIKLGNLFLSERMMVKLGDFGLSTKLDFNGERKRTICGTPNYIAPEVLEGKQGHSYEADIWSFGVLLYALLIGKPPFETADVKTTYRKIKMNAYSFPENISLSEAAKGLITKILVLDPSKRPSWQDILAHEFFHQGNVIPKLMPTAALACPPSKAFLEKYAPAISGNNALEPRVSLGSSAPVSTEQLRSSIPSSARLHKPEPITTDRFSKISTENARSPAVSSTALNANAEAWVKKWVDYSSKYGIGYLLTTGYVGVVFNDATKVVSSPDGTTFWYIERKGEDHKEAMDFYTSSTFPAALQKKVTLLHHFRSYLHPEASFQLTTSPVYVKRWTRTRHAILFRLSNKIVQVIFQDHTELVLSSEHKLVTFVDKQGERTSHPLSSALESGNPELSKRLRYTKELLADMMAGRHVGY